MAKKYRPVRLRTRKPGRERCDDVRSPTGSTLKLCVVEGKYGFSARLYPARDKSKWVPVSTGRARTLKSAMSKAKQSVRRTMQRSRR